MLKDYQILNELNDKFDSFFKSIEKITFLETNEKP